MGGFLHGYFLNGAQFYNLFDQAARNAVDMARLLNSVVSTDSAEQKEHFHKQIDRLENIGDDITHKIYIALDKVIFTPLNRGDIHTLASAIDDVADFIHEASERMYLYDIQEVLIDMKAIAAIILKAATEMEKAINLLRDKQQGSMVLSLCRQIKDYEHDADHVYYQALANLFADEKNAITLIKNREILHSLESTANKCKNVTEVLQAILLSY